MAMTTSLTWMQEKILQILLRGKKFSLLYKASAHEFSPSNLFEICCNQGPILILIYGDHVIGAYVSENCQRETPVSILLFAFQETEISRCKIGPYEPLKLFGGNVCESNLEFYINLRKQKVTMNLKLIKILNLPECSNISFQECEVFRCEDLLDTRKIQGVTVLRESLLSALRTYKPYKELVHQTRILLLGPVGAGKSSFFNSVKSVFRGHVTHQALVGSDTTGITEQYRTYSIKDGKDGKSLPFILCDSMGLDEEEGMCMGDILHILKGHISDRYQFNFTKPITPGHGNWNDFPLLEDRIHCVAIVFDANSVEDLSSEMVAKIKRIRREMIKCGMAHVVLLTHVDNMALIRKGDLIDIYRYMPVKLKLEAVHEKLGFALSDILVVSNYTSEWDVDPVKDVLILSALRQMLWAADDFLEDLPLEETGLPRLSPS
ncbi:interferon-induced protein 44 isoform X2 [Rhinolophus ferrumequinum]|uniref:Interferon-induced protein 44 n=1 Tax=Rhinolophus ferrumequinum TaxID=59479 RepID=A0A671EB24_RHIFE|nr:interferon-induced protein 44 isoform X2 [Rhinolophus ferrumequinum]